MTPELLAALYRAKEVMQKRVPIGAPLVELPISHLRTFTDNRGEVRAVIDIDHLIYVVDEVLRSTLSSE